MGYVITVSGAVGGIGTSTIAYALALQPQGTAVLIDGQPDGAPLDILLGSESMPGTRWSQVRVRSAAIEANAVLSALPVVHGVHVLSADREGWADAAALPHLVQCLRERCELVVLDVPARGQLDLGNVDLRLLLLPATVTGVGAALAMQDGPTRLLLVHSGRADFPPHAVGEYLDHEVLGSVRWQRGVTDASVACTPPPAGSDVMRIAAVAWEAVRNVA